MPVGSRITSAARAVIEVELDRLGLDRARQGIRETAVQGGRDFDRMSVAQLRVARAQERVNAEQRRYDGEVQHTLASTLRLREAEERLRREQVRVAHEGASGFSILNRGVQANERAYGRATRAAERHHTTLRQHARSAVGFGLSSVLGLGVGFGVERLAAGSIEAATEDQAAEAALERQLNAVGVSYARNRVQIQETLRAQGEMSGFLQHELIQSFTTFVRRTGDVNQALHLNSVAMDIARARHQDLNGVAILLNRALNGNARAATTLGLPLVKVTEATDALRRSGEKATSQQKLQAKQADTFATGQRIIAEAQQRYAGQAEAYSATAAGAQARLNRAFHESEVTVGTALLPTVTRLATSFANYLNRLNSTGRLQRDVNSTVRVAGQLFRGLRSIISAVAAVIRPLNHALGGTTNAVKLLGAAFISYKAIGILGYFSRMRGGAVAAEGGVGLLSKSLGTAGLAASAGVAAFALTTLILRLTGADKALARAGGAVQGFLTRLPGGNRALGAVGLGDDYGRFSGKVTPSQKQASAVIAAARQMKAQGWSKQQVIGQFQQWHPDWDPGSIETLVNDAFNVTPTSDTGRGADIGNTGTVTPTRRARRRTASSPYGDIRLDDTGAAIIPYDIRLALAKNPDDERALTEEADYLKRAIASHRLKGDNLISAYSDLQSIDQQLAQKAKDQADKATRAREKAAREAAAARRRQRVQEQRIARRAERRRETAVTGRLLGFRRRLTAAEATPENNDDLAVLHDEATYLRSEIRNKNLAIRYRQRLERDLDSVNQKINRLRKRTKAKAVDFAALQRGAISTLNEIIQNESNFAGGTTINVNQHFPHPPTDDGRREAILAHHAAQASFA